MSVATDTVMPATRPSVTEALVNASRETGIDFGYLLVTAQRESSLDPSAKSKTSSASGLFQFIEQTWLATLKAHGAQHGFAAEAAAIEEGPSGRLTVADPAQRRAILSLRNDPSVSSLMAAELTRDSRAQLERRLGRSIEPSELYLAHFLGPGEAARFIAEHDSSPDGVAAESFPAAAQANAPIFYRADGSARTLAEVKSQLTRPHDRAPVEEPIAAAWQGVRDEADMLSGRFSKAAGAWTLPAQALKLTPQVLNILLSLNPIPDSQSAQRSYRALLMSDESHRDRLS